jgi:hypothetical protein
MLLLFCLHKLLLRIWRVYISYVMLTIALRVNGNKIPAVSFYLLKIDYFCHEIILDYLEALVKFLEICYIPLNCR